MFSYIPQCSSTLMEEIFGDNIYKCHNFKTILTAEKAVNIFKLLYMTQEYFLLNQLMSHRAITDNVI